MYFFRSWWLEAVCPKGFEILVLRKGGRLVANMPMIRSRKLGREPFINIIESILLPLGLKKDPHDNFDEMIELADSFDEQAGSPKRQSIYFIRTGGSSKYERGHDIHKTVIQDIIKRANITVSLSYNGTMTGLFAGIKTITRVFTGECWKNYLRTNRFARI